MNGRAKLTTDQIQEIRTRYKQGAKWWAPEGSAKALAREFGVCDRTIKRAVEMETWRQIDAALATSPGERK